jgi:hypothetical protein
VAKKKPKPKASEDLLLVKYREDYRKHDAAAAKAHEAMSRTAQAFADRSAALVGLAIGDYIDVKEYGREVPGVVVKHGASCPFYNDDVLTWKIYYHVIKSDGSPRLKQRLRSVAGLDDGYDDKWRKITKEEACELAKKQRLSG